ncbi:FecR domain-containing protein [Rhodopirellula sp. SWK7]|uniref:FecR domain-containing protein n=1 Tax=Rhodopirellula sp. SWK7 TaxID=595460 RepID=UPI0002BE0977|nr:FecR domain-containing protein [Rhodopirellula sp. SWK7]EMI45680.1 FecR protein domain protein [Rhodopirellula sp. SWK7]
MDDKRFQQLLTAYFEDDLSETDTAELHSAVTSSDRHRRRFQEESRVNVLLRETLVEQTELQSLTASCDVAPARSQWQVAFAAIAATLLIAFAAGSWIRRDSGHSIGVCMSISGAVDLMVRRGDDQFRATPGFKLHEHDEVVCDSQTQAMLRLNDGSIVSMETNSTLKLENAPAQVRLIQGEAFFEIAPRQNGMPAFEVLTGHSTIEVMGTVFSLVASANTEIKVYEGSVTLTRNSDRAAIQVSSQQMATSDDLAVQDLAALPLESVQLSPTDDLTLDGGKREKKFQLLKVEGGRRIVYLRFDLPELNRFRSAKLRLTQAIDSGSGTLRFFVGDHSDWTESELTESVAPQPTIEVAQHRGVVASGQVVEVDVSAAVKTPGPLTIIVTLDQSGENDIWFGARESETPPMLILNRPH